MGKWGLGWSIVDASSGKPVVFDARWPVYWLRRIAKAEAEKRRLTNVRIVRVSAKATR